MFLKNSEMTLHAILANPDDLEAYRAHADALIEEGDENRGKFVAKYLQARLSVASMNASVLITNINNKITVDDTEIIPCLGLGDTLKDGLNTIGVIIESGFVTHLKCQHDFFMAWAVELFKKHPIRSVFLTDRYPYVPRDPRSNHPLAGSEDLCAAYWGDLSTSSYTKNDPNLLHDSLTAHIKGQEIWEMPFKRYNRGVFWHGFPDVPAALQAASLACVKFGRNITDLSSLAETAYRPLCLRQNSFGNFVCAAFD